MARCCGQSGSCACKVEAGRHVTVTGTGTSQDPFVIAATTYLASDDNETFNVAIYGGGTLDSPWVLSVGYATTARLTDTPDVDAPAPSNGYVLSYSTSSHSWVPAPPATATPGLVVTGNSTQGDGSSGNPLDVTPDPARFLSITGAGLGLNTDGVNRMIRPFANLAARAAASPSPATGTVSMLLDSPGRLDYYDGTDWQPLVADVTVSVLDNQEFLALSGGYTGGPVTQFVKQLSEVSDGSGAFIVLSADDLTGYAGVLSVSVQPVGTGVKWAAEVSGGGGIVSGRAYKLTDGTTKAGFSLSAIVTALLY